MTIVENYLESISTGDPREAKGGYSALAYKTSKMISPHLFQDANGAANRKILLSSISGVALSASSAADTRTAAEKKMAEMRGNYTSEGSIDVTTMSGGLAEVFQIPIPPGKFDEAKAFAQSLQSAVASAGGAKSLASSAAEQTKVCPECAEDIKLAAKKCRYCSHQFSDDEMVAAELEAEKAAIGRAAARASDAAAVATPAAPSQASTAGPSASGRKKRNPLVVGAIVIGSLVVLGTLIPMAAFFGPLLLAGAIGSSMPDPDALPEIAPSIAITSPAVSAPAPQAATGWLSDAQIAEGYQYTADNGAAWRVTSADEDANLVCTDALDDGELCNHVLVLTTPQCSAIEVVYNLSGSSPTKQTAVDPNAQPMEISIWSTDVTRVACI